MVIKCQYEQWIEASRLTPKADQWFMFWHLPVRILAYYVLSLGTQRCSLDSLALSSPSFTWPAGVLQHFPFLRWERHRCHRGFPAARSPLYHISWLCMHMGDARRKQVKAVLFQRGLVHWISCPAKLSSNVDKHWLCGHSYAATGWFNLVKEHKRVHTLLHLIQHVSMFDINDIKMYSGRECE